MPDYSYGEVVIRPFSYTDMQSSKRRPALILLDSDDGDVLVSRITSKHYDTPYDVEITSWSEVGLLVPSYIRLHKMIAVESSHIIKRLKKLSIEDLRIIKDTFRKIL